uniref:Si:ch211-130m23.2 n=1 Tax=Scleropages formosus TaxID=113540 RepID=A0A8C9RXM9_SCLFO
MFSFYISYDAVNESNTFGAGDFISGRIFLEVSKEVKLSSLSVKAKGKAKVLWSERYGQVTVVYHAKEKYFSQERVLVQERAAGDDSVLSPGIHVYSFTFQIPQGNMPSSFKGCYGKIIYTLEAKLSRPMRVSSKAMAEFTFVSKPDVMNIISILQEPQFGTRSKNLKFLTSGNVSMDIQTEKMGYMQGEVLQVVAQINNISSRIVTPKISLYQKQSFFAKGKRKLYIKKILKEKGESIPPGTHRSVTQQLTIPVDLPPSVLNCPILQVEYRLKVG